MCGLILVAVAVASLALPAGAGTSYPPPSTTRPTPPTTGTPPTTLTPPTTSVTPTSVAPTQPTSPTTRPASTAATQVAFTGSDSTPLVIIGIVAVTLGAILVVAARRRSSVQAPKGS
jgi:LPXTG-motif cell wall-anchored protein